MFTADLPSDKAQEKSAVARNCYRARANQVLWGILGLLPPFKARTVKQLGKLIFCESLRHFRVHVTQKRVAGKGFTQKKQKGKGSD